MFHYIKAGRGFGPVTARDLLRMYQDGVLAPEDPVRPEDDATWLAAADAVGRLLRGDWGYHSSRPPPPRELGGKHTVFTTAPPAPGRSSARPCGACGEPLEASARFCPRCGRAALGWCAACCAASGPDARFCALCGAPVAH